MDLMTLDSGGGKSLGGAAINGARLNDFLIENILLGQHGKIALDTCANERHGLKAVELENALRTNCKGLFTFTDVKPEMFLSALHAGVFWRNEMGNQVNLFNDFFLEKLFSPTRVEVTSRNKDKVLAKYHLSEKDVVKGDDMSYVELHHSDVRIVVIDTQAFTSKKGPLIMPEIFRADLFLGCMGVFVLARNPTIQTDLETVTNGKEDYTFNYVSFLHTAQGRMTLMNSYFVTVSGIPLIRSLEGADMLVYSYTSNLGAGKFAADDNCNELLAQDYTYTSQFFYTSKIEVDESNGLVKSYYRNKKFSPAVASAFGQSRCFLDSGNASRLVSLMDQEVPTFPGADRGDFWLLASFFNHTKAILTIVPLFFTENIRLGKVQIQGSTDGILYSGSLMNAASKQISLKNWLHPYCEAYKNKTTMDKVTDGWDISLSAGSFYARKFVADFIESYLGDNDEWKDQALMAASTRDDHGIGHRTTTNLFWICDPNGCVRGQGATYNVFRERVPAEILKCAGYVDPSPIDQYNSSFLDMVLLTPEELKKLSKNLTDDDKSIVLQYLRNERNIVSVDEDDYHMWPKKEALLDRKDISTYSLQPRDYVHDASEADKKENKIEAALEMWGVRNL